jgi:hypothetical protein
VRPFLFLILLAFCSPAASADVDANARLLAGMLPRDASFEWLTRDPAWLTHAADMDKAWSRVEERQLARIREWAPQHLGRTHNDTAPMFYMFSGPDFLYANAFFPAARTYILCGIEPVGTAPDLEQIADAEIPTALVNLRRSMESLLNWSFFITKNMKTDLAQTQLSGTLPVMLVFLARSGYTIDAIQPVALDDSGFIVAPGRSTTPGVRVEFSSSNGGAQTLYYFTSNLADYAIQQRPGFLAFCARQGQGLSLLKAASYLMHVPGFTRAREFLLANSKLILQDDSGIPHRFFDIGDWNLDYFGRYTAPIKTFEQHLQPELARAFAAAQPEPLPFSFGYQWHPRQSSLVIARPISRRD